MARTASLGRRSAMNVTAVVFGLLWVFPVYWLVNSSLGTDAALQSRTPQLLPLDLTWAHYQAVLADGRFWSALRMSLGVALMVVVASLVFAFFAALALSRFRFRARKAIIVAVLVIQMIPAESLFISQYKMIDGWHLLNSAMGLGLLYVGASVPFTIWMLKGFVDGVPVELEESAMLDGCSRMGAFMRVTMPLLGSGLVASGIFAFLASWNEYTLALVMLSSDNSKTLPLWITGFSGPNQETDWGGVMAGATLMAIPVIVLFAIVQKKMAQGLVAGAVKG